MGRRDNEKKRQMVKETMCKRDNGENRKKGNRDYDDERQRVKETMGKRDKRVKETKR